MRTNVSPIIAALLFTGTCLSAPLPTSAVSQLHVISMHVQDHAAFDAVFLLLRDVLELPLVYGELSKPGNNARRCYAGFSVGNAYLEPCGPYKSDVPFSPDRPARWHGLTFSPATTIVDAAEELGRKGIAHSEVMGRGETPRFVYVTNALLAGTRLAVSIWEIQNTNDSVNLNFLHSSLQKAGGGALGVKGLQEVSIQLPGKSSLAEWRNLLSTTNREGDVCLVGNGPALRLVAGTDMQIESILLRVESLEKAKAALSQRRLLGRIAADHVELDPAKTSGLRITLREK